MTTALHDKPPVGGRIRQRGFTLAEVLISMTISTVVLGMVLTINLQSSKQLFYSQQKSLINTDIRNITERLAADARDASFFVLYSNYTVAARTSIGQRLVEGNPGDFLLLVYYDDRDPPPDPIHFNVLPLWKLVGYYRAPYQPGQADPITNDPYGMPVRRFELSTDAGTLAHNLYIMDAAHTPAGGTYVTLESLLPNDASATIKSHQIIVQLADGLADGLLFYNFWNKSIMVNAKIDHGNNAKQITDTYNFTVSPRG